MMPDLNSLSASRQTPSTPTSPRSQRPRRISINTTDHFPSPPSPRSPSLSSLQAAAMINAGLHRSSSNMSPARQGLERRRSSLMNNLSMNDPAVPAPGEMQPAGSPRYVGRTLSYSTADPNHHQRQPSLGELHQELEQEQEAQVNRLLHMINMQQDQLVNMQRQQQQASSQENPTPSPTSTEQTHFPTPPSTQGTPAGTNITEQSSPRGSLSGLPHSHGYFHRPHSLSRQSSARASAAGTNSRGNSPALRPVSGSLGPLTEDFLLGTARDESAFYQAETQTLTRENQMLKNRIRELEKQVADMNIQSSHNEANSAGGSLRHSPIPHSPLASPPATFTSESATPAPADPNVTASVKVE